jgi:hypothetical protein
MNGSLRNRISSAVIWSRSAPSSTGFTAPATLSLRPPIGGTTSTTLTWPERFGAMRQFEAMAGRAVVVTVPWMSVC